MRILMLVLFLFGLTAARMRASGLPQEVAAQLAHAALTDSNAMAIVTDLTTEIGPRLAGSEAEKRAAEWAKQRFKSLGFDKAWIESFQIERRWVRGVEKAEILGPSPQPLAVTTLGGSVATPSGGIEAEIALFKTYEELLAAPAGALTGKIAVVTQPMVRAQDGEGYGFAGKIRHSGASEAARRGAVAYLLRSLGTDSHRLPHTGVMEYLIGVPRIPAAALSVPDAQQLERLVAKEQPVRLRLELTPQELNPASSQNVIAEIKGREQPEALVLLGAHLDSWDLGTGALDDGAGVAIVTAAAKLIADLPQRPRRTIRVVLFGSEETGLFGGKAYAAAHKEELNRYAIAAESDGGQGPVYRFETGVANPDDSAIKTMRTALVLLGVVPGNNQSKGDSDIEPLVALGVPTVTLKPDATDYFDFHHTADDTLDKIDPRRLNQSTAAFAAFAYLAAELETDFRASAPTASK